MTLATLSFAVSAELRNLGLEREKDEGLLFPHPEDGMLAKIGKDAKNELSRGELISFPRPFQTLSNPFPSLD
jgi:hypothetical protein